MNIRTLAEGHIGVLLCSVTDAATYRYCVRVGKRYRDSTLGAAYMVGAGHRPASLDAARITEAQLAARPGVRDGRSPAQIKAAHRRAQARVAFLARRCGNL